MSERETIRIDGKDIPIYRNEEGEVICGDIFNRCPFLRGRRMSKMRCIKNTLRPRVHVRSRVPIEYINGEFITAEGCAIELELGVEMEEMIYQAAVRDKQRKIKAGEHHA
jgi:hypothetical protein